MTDEHDESTAATVVHAAETATKTRAEERTKTRKLPPYHVIIMNDEEHTFEYVIELLSKIFQHDLTTAEVLTWRIHNTGRCVVLTTHKEKAELKRDQVLAYGPDPRLKKSKGSMSCYIEPAPSD